MLCGMSVSEFPKWLDNMDTDAVGVFKLNDGECLTADVLDFDMDRRELKVDVISSNHPPSDSSRRDRAISVDSVDSFEPRSRTEQPWPYSDPCRSMSFSAGRFALMTMLFLGWIVGGLSLFLFLVGRPYGIQEASVISYTAFVTFFTFARTGSRTGKDLPPFMFTCPAVRTQISPLLWRHLGFLLTLFAIQTTALATRPNLPDWWNTESGRNGGTPFELALMLLCVGIGFVQVFTNRRLLGRAHRECSS